MRIPTFYQGQHNIQIITKQFEQMNRLIQQASEGKKILASSEDPVLAGQIKSNQTFTDNLQNYNNNGLLAQNRSNLFSTTLRSTGTIVDDVRSVINKVQSGTLNDNDRASVAKQLEGDLSRLLAYANTTDADGNYIFSGFNTNTLPYVQVNGSYQYQGGLNEAMIDIGPNVNVLYYDSGFKVFGDIFSGNGTFTINTGSTNAGNAYSSAGSVVDTANYVPDTYTLTFVTNSNGQLAYSVAGATSGQVIPPPPGTIPADAPAYNTKSDITFNGLSFSIDGAPKVGDTFTIQPSTQQNVFNTLQNLINTLKAPVTNQGAYNQVLSQISASFSQISSHLVTYESEVGTRAITVTNQVQNNATILTNYTIALSNLEDADPYQVYSALAQKSATLEATQQCYMKLQETLLYLLKL